MALLYSLINEPSDSELMRHTRPHLLSPGNFPLPRLHQKTHSWGHPFLLWTPETSSLPFVPWLRCPLPKLQKAREALPSFTPQERSGSSLPSPERASFALLPTGAPWDAWWPADSLHAHTHPPHTLNCNNQNKASSWKQGLCKIHFHISTVLK